MSLIVELVKKIIRDNSGDPGFEIQFMDMEESDIVLYHHTVGRALRNSQGLWTDNPLVDEFKSIGIWHADDMSAVLLLSTHRILNRKPCDVSGMIQGFAEHWKKFGVDPKTGEQIDGAKQMEREVYNYGTD